MTDIFSKAKQAQAKAAKAKQANVTPVKQANESKVDNLSELSDNLQKSVIYAAFYAVYQKSGSLYNQASVDGLLENVNKALDTDAYVDFAHNVGVIANALLAIQDKIVTPLSADDIIKGALAESPDESPKDVLNRLIKDKAITGADARRYLEALLGW